MSNDQLLSEAKSVLADLFCSIECHAAERKPKGDWDEYDHFMIPKWQNAQKFFAKIPVLEASETANENSVTLTKQEWKLLNTVMWQLVWGKHEAAQAWKQLHESVEARFTKQGAT